MLADGDAEIELPTEGDVLTLTDGDTDILALGLIDGLALTLWLGETDTEAEMLTEGDALID